MASNAEMFPYDDVIMDWALSLLTPITYSYSDGKQWQMYPDLGHSIDKHTAYCKILSRQIYERIHLNHMNPMLDIELLSYQIEPQEFIANIPDHGMYVAISFQFPPGSLCTSAGGKLPPFIEFYISVE